jgi:type I restriction enzyme S subunit
MARPMKDSGVEWIGEIPSDWGTIKFKYLHEGLNTGEAIDKEFWSNEENDKIFYTAGLVPIRTNYCDFPSWKYTRKNDLLLARNGTPYVYFPVTGACYTDHIIRAAMKTHINRRFVQYSLQQSITSVVVDSVSIATWSASLWNEQTIAWPSPEEQNRISDFLDSQCAAIDAVLDKTRASIEEYKKLKQSVITQAVTKGVRGDRPMKDSGIECLGDIPDTWIVRPLKYFIDILPGYAFSSDDFSSDEGMPLLRGVNVAPGKIKWSESVYFKKNISKELEPFVLQSHDLVVGLDRPWISSGMRVAFMTEKDIPALLVQRVCRIRTNDLMETRFIYYALSSKIFENSLTTETTGVSVPHISTKQIQQFTIPVPNICEQVSICDYLDEKCVEIDALIAKKEQFLAELENYKKSLIYEYVTGKKEVV